jgi:hypothetical protein
VTIIFDEKNMCVKRRRMPSQLLNKRSSHRETGHSEVRGKARAKEEEESFLLMLDQAATQAKHLLAPTVPMLTPPQMIVRTAWETAGEC